MQRLECSYISKAPAIPDAALIDIIGTDGAGAAIIRRNTRRRGEQGGRIRCRARRRRRPDSGVRVAEVIAAAVLYAAGTDLVDTYGLRTLGLFRGSGRGARQEGCQSESRV
jgi:hypothetical protein